MDQNAAVTSVVFARRPGSVAPFELGHEFVVCEIRFPRAQIAIMLPADSQKPILQCEYMIRVVLLPKPPQKRVKAVEILAVEQMNGRRLFRCRNAAGKHRYHDDENRSSEQG